MLHLSESVKKTLSRPSAVVGLGVSNLPLVRFLLEHGDLASVRDLHKSEGLDELLPLLREKNVAVLTGENYLRDLHEEVIYRTPGIRPDIPEFRSAVKAGAKLSSEIELFLSLTPATVLGITGSDGKTTTTTLTGRILDAYCQRTEIGKTYVGGNIGNSLLPDVAKMTKKDFAVLELSSFQLCTLSRSAEYAALTNLSPNHLNWHTGMEEYKAAKTNLFSHPQNRYFVTNAENGTAYSLTKDHGGKVSLFSSVKHRYEEFDWLCGRGIAVYARDGFVFRSDGHREEKILPLSDFLLPGKHNLENLLCAVALSSPFASGEDVRRACVDFHGVKHRLEYVRTFDGVTYYNSSIDSTPSRTAAAISALPKKPIVICGGYDKNLSFSPLAETLTRNAKSVILTGATAEKIFDALLHFSKYSQDVLPIFKVPDFENAVRCAKNLAKEGDIVLLSPACASFDAFRNFEERGEYFCKIVKSFS